jgi:hypothetical protein
MSKHARYRALKHSIDNHINIQFKLADSQALAFEETIRSCPQLVLSRDEPELAKGWFRLIKSRKL